MRQAMIVSAGRTAIGKAPRGTLKDTRPDELAAAVIREAVRRVPGLVGEMVEDVVLGCAIPEAEQGLNVARVAALRAGLPVTTSGQTINRFCSSGLQAIATAAHEGMTGHKYAPNPNLTAEWPEIFISMGLTAEIVAQRFHISREDQDRFSLRSHQRAAAAIAQGRCAGATLAPPGSPPGGWWRKT